MQRTLPPAAIGKSTNDAIDDPERAPRLLRRVGGACFAWLFAVGVGWLAIRGGRDWFKVDAIALALVVPAILVAVGVFVNAWLRWMRGKPSSELAMVFAGSATLGGMLHLLVLWIDRADHVYPYIFSHGRRLHTGRTLLAPRAEVGAGWTRGDAAVDASKVVLEVPDELRAAVAGHWRATAAMEHASIAAFSQLTLDLLSVGAPAHLVAAAQRAGLDEVRHAEIGYAIAQRIDGAEASPAPFPEAHTRRALPAHRPRALARIAVDALTDGALNEGIAARLLGQCGRDCAEPALAELLGGMAADESRHAQDSWDVIAWCLQEGGDVVHRALRQARASMPDTMGSSLPDDAREGAWTGWGVQSVALEARAYAAVRGHAQERLLAMLGDRARGEAA